MIDRVRTLCSTVPNVTLHIHDGRTSQRLDADTLLRLCELRDGRLDVWFCGPADFAKRLQSGLQRVLGHGVRMYREAFDMR